MIFKNSEINDMTWKPFFQNSQNPSSKHLDFQVKMCFALKILPQGRTVFTETTVFKFRRKQRFLAMLSQ